MNSSSSFPVIHIVFRTLYIVRSYTGCHSSKTRSFHFFLLWYRWKKCTEKPFQLRSLAYCICQKYWSQSEQRTSLCVCALIFSWNSLFFSHAHTCFMQFDTPSTTDASIRAISCSCLIARKDDWRIFFSISFCRLPPFFHSVVLEKLRGTFHSGEALSKF